MSFKRRGLGLGICVESTSSLYSKLQRRGCLRDFFIFVLASNSDELTATTLCYEQHPRMHQRTLFIHRLMLSSTDSNQTSSLASTNRFDAISKITIASLSARHSQHLRVVSLLPMLISDLLNSNHARSKLFDLAFAQHHSSFSTLSASPPSLVHMLLPTIAFNNQHVLGSFMMKSEMEGNNNTICY
ncbi:unnamed protein product [Vicia faba]|uniref:Uncharacterized protein n=1 Tax=Vicia faba TaxID=3906 RepID=A0AAV1AX32_VICFA|nr:unnamed protein product [Vicia faba]